MSDGSSTINIPQLIVLLVVSFLVFRWYNSSTPAEAGTRASAGRNASSRVNLASVEQIAQMFPQLNRRHIAWDLQRNGGNVAATTERVLGGRALEVPPPSFQPQLPPVSSQTVPTAAAPQSSPTHPDLITRYNLSSKIKAGSSAPESPTESTSQKSTWSQSKTERQQILQRRREEMILAARRKLEEQDNAKVGGAS
ncbi:hypothetical protein K490DRAFT_61366 [Saccharata proteae CBS 121410]|uniref:Coupling of ubiquitin conjugation to ER degradation protein 1 n=1 Tax=Saccharata proteae CBS 121410 TaxID=1314787 RepID=A0A9P4I393_9PEZI|nr:hypothetical protein K490DRAFT_61366 [Saccharata proteae CBS 121410]